MIEGLTNQIKINHRLLSVKNDFCSLYQTKSLITTIKIKFQINQTKTTKTRFYLN